MALNYFFPNLRGEMQSKFGRNKVQNCNLQVCKVSLNTLDRVASDRKVFWVT